MSFLPYSKQLTLVSMVTSLLFVVFALNQITTIIIGANVFEIILRDSARYCRPVAYPGSC
jgi:hypothetical protein